MKKAPKKKWKKGYQTGGTTMIAKDTPDDYVVKPREGKKKGEAKFGDYLADAGRLVVDNAAGMVGLDSLVKNNYKTELGQKANKFRENVVAPIQKAGISAGLNLVAPGAGTLYNKATTAADVASTKATRSREPGESDLDYSKRMAAIGIDVTDKNTGLQGTEGGVGKAIEMGVGVLGRKEGGGVSATKAKYILKEGSIRGKKLSPKQKRYFSLIAGGENPGMADGGETKSGKKKIVLSPDVAKAHLANTAYLSGARGILDAKIREKLKVGEDYPIPNEAALSPEEVAAALEGSEYSDYYGKLKEVGDFYHKYNLPYYDLEGNQLKEFVGANEEGLPIEQTAYGWRHRNLRLDKKGKAKEAVSQEEFQNYVAGKAEGGKIEGKGTAKSDSINANVKDGSFVVPAENADVAEALYKKYFGKKPGKATLNEGGGADTVDVRLSDEEFMFSPEEKDALEAQGISLDMLAPNAEDNSEGLANGGETGDSLKDIEALLSAYKEQEKRRDAAEKAASEKGLKEVKDRMRQVEKQVLVDDRYKRLEELATKLKAKGEINAFDAAKLAEATKKYKEGVSRYDKKYKIEIKPTEGESKAIESVESMSAKPTAAGNVYTPDPLGAAKRSAEGRVDEKTGTGIAAANNRGAKPASKEDIVTPEKLSKIDVNQIPVVAPDRKISEAGVTDGTGAGITLDSVGVTKTKDGATEFKRPEIGTEDILAAGQIGLGITSLFKSGDRPVDKIDDAFNQAVEQAREESTYGLDKATLALYGKRIETARRGAVGLAAQTSGADPTRANAVARAATNDYADNLLKMASADANTRLQKQGYAARLTGQRAQMKRRLFEDSMNAFDQNQMAGADLLSSGIENLFTNKRNEQARQAVEEANKASQVNIDFSGLSKYVANELKQGGTGSNSPNITLGE